MGLSPLLFLLLSALAGAQTVAPVARAPFDVSHYDISLRPDLNERTIKATAEISFISQSDNLTEVELEAEELSFDGVWEGAEAREFKAADNKLLVKLARPAARGETRKLKITYHARPTRGVRFYPDHVYTVYNTKRWLPCRFHPSDKATLTLRLTLPAGMKAVANGRLVEQKSLGANETEQVWRQTTPVPAYIFGFAAGRFREVVSRRGGVSSRVLFREYTPEEASRVFADTPDAARFFAERAGFPLADGAYTQVLASGNAEQEMSGFTVIRETYGREVLADARENWLGIHELSHEWWGNSLTCADWSHFWLNEGVASFMTDAYQERRFGRDEYDMQMALSREVYARLRAAGRDRPLAYRHDIEERNAGGAAVYHKGALVLHLLRFQLGERAFWQGFKDYTRAHAGASVTTDDLQRAMERAAGQNLSEFFDHWVYSADAPDIRARHRLEGRELVVEIEQRQQALWPVPLRVAVETERGRDARTVLLKERRHEFRFPARGEPLSVRLDDGGHLPVRVEHERDTRMLLRQLAREPDLAGRLDALERLQQRCGGDSKTPREPACQSYGAALAERAANDPSRLIRERARDYGKKN